MTTPQNNKPEDAGTLPDGGAPVAETVYAPASERVPKTVPDYRDVTAGTDATTAERQAVSAGPEPEPSFTRVPRPAYAPPVEEPAQTSWDTSNSDWMNSGSSGVGLPMKVAWLGLGVAGGVGAWLLLRWQRERNKPMNRFRRQARQAAGQARKQATALREQMPDLPELPNDARRPAVGLGTALLTLGVVLWQQSQARSREEEAARAAARTAKEARKTGKRAVDMISDVDWMERLQHLRDLWNPTRVELEKVSIPRR
jgi:hypothetical protein